MTEAEIVGAVQDVQAAVGCDEHAHGLEIGLHQSVLRAIADGEVDDPKKAAELALRTTGIKFCRWYA